MDDQTRTQTTTPTPAPGGTWGAPPPPPASPAGFSWSDFFSFRYMITPSIIRVLYILGVAAITIGALSSINGFGMGFGGGILGALLFFIVGQLYLRVIMELLVVFFGMHESLRKIERQDRR